MPTRTARTAWNGTLEAGSGQVELTSSGVATFDVSFPKRAAEEAGGTTSPEELIAAAHSSCYAMQLSALIAEAVQGLRNHPGGDQIDTVVLACTHFPLVQEELAALLGPDVRFIDGAAGIARRIAALTNGQAFDRTAPDYAVFTGGPLDPGLTPALEHYGLTRAELF